MTEFVNVVLRADVPTPLGILPRGTTQQAAPAPDGQWLVRVAEGHTVTVAERAIWSGYKRRQALETVRAVWEEYTFATEVIGFSHAAALKWLQQSYGVEERQLYRWGFDNPRTGVAS